MYLSDAKIVIIFDTTKFVAYKFNHYTRFLRYAGARMLIDNIEINAQSVSSVRDIQDTDAEITPVPGGVQVVTDTETPVSIYTIDGIILVNAEPVRGRRTFTIPSAGLYIIAAGDTVRRLALR